MTPTVLDDKSLRALPPMVSFTRAARAIGMGRTKAFQLKAEGKFPLPLKEQGKRVLVPRSAILAHLELEQAA